jgi:hypothetical protein
MICPRCVSTQSDDVRFCTLCGANLQAVRQAIEVKEADEKFSWDKTWVAEMFLSHEEQKKRNAALERQRGLTPEVKRYNEIKAGVITCSVGIAVSIFLYVLMQGVILGGNNAPGDVEILKRVWVAGVIPFFVGLALIVNGVVVSKRQIESNKQQSGPNNLEGDAGPQALRAPDTNDFASSPFSVTEQTTKHLHSVDKK